MKNYTLLRNLLSVVLCVFLNLGESVGYKASAVTPITRFTGSRVASFCKAPSLGNYASGVHPSASTFPTFEVETKEVERCWGDAVQFTVTAIDGDPQALLPGGMSFVLFEGTPDNVLASTTGRTIEMHMPPTAEPNIQMTYLLVIKDNNGDYGDKTEVFVTWHYINNQIAIDAGYSGSAPYLQRYPIQFVAEPGNDVYVWTWGDGSDDTVYGDNTAVHSFDEAKSYNISVRITKYFKVPSGECSVIGTLDGLNIVVPLCEMVLPGAGQFKQNTRSGAISFVSTISSCQPIASLECLGEGIAVEHVVAATATSFTDQLPATLPTGLTAANPYLAGQWRTTPQASYSFRTSLALDLHNYSAGTFSLQPFDWTSSLRARPAAWLTAAVTEKISVNGDVLQERDPLGIPSAAKFGYGVTPAGTSAQLLPYLQAHNAEYSTVFFESFENVYTANGVTTGEDGFALANSNAVSTAVDLSVVTCNSQTEQCPTYAHTGNACALVQERQIRLLPMAQTAQLIASDLLIKAWVHFQLPAASQVSLQDMEQLPSTVSLERYSPQNGGLAGAFLPGGAAFKAIAQTGDWLLYEARIPMNITGLAIGELFLPRIGFTSPLLPDGSGATAPTWVDDIRVQPADAQMTTYVYDPVTLRLVASFDDQHFALRYQYNTEGKLIRKQADTERGLKTLQETHYHTPTTTQVDE